MPFTITNRKPRIQGFNGWSIVLGPYESPDGSDTLTLTDEQVKLLQADPAFEGMVLNKEIKLEGGSLREFLGRELKMRPKTPDEKYAPQILKKPNGEDEVQTPMLKSPPPDAPSEDGKLPAFASFLSATKKKGG